EICHSDHNRQKRGLPAAQSRAVSSRRHLSAKASNVASDIVLRCTVAMLALKLQAISFFLCTLQSSGKKLPHLYNPMFPRRREHRFAQGDGLEVIAAADLGFDIVFQGAQELGHGADEGVGEPDFLPARLEPV